MLSSHGLVKPVPSTMSALLIGFLAMNPPVARAESTKRFALATSSSVGPCDGVTLRPEKMLARFTTAAVAGLASGTLMTSILQRAELGFESGRSRTQPGNSVGERIWADPDT